MRVEIPITADEARFLSESAANMGMTLPDYLYRVAVDHANAERRRRAGSGNVGVPQLQWRWR